MKKLSLLLVLMVSLIVIGCSNETAEVDYEAEMRVLANEIFEEHFIQENDVDVYQVNIDGIRNLNNFGYDYDLGNLEDCTGESRVDLHLDKSTFEITEYEFFMNCK